MRWRKLVLLKREALLPHWCVLFPKHDFGTGRLAQYPLDTFERACAARPPVDAKTHQLRKRLDDPYGWQDIYESRDWPAPQVTIEALLVSVVERGLKALDEPKNIERLSRCDERARAEIKRRIAKLEAEGRVGIGLAPPDASAKRFMKQMEDDPEFQRIWRPAVEKFHGRS
jgi:hypothetical protein